jgi:mono/diheme cytochrome c family protein
LDRFLPFAVAVALLCAALGCSKRSAETAQRPKAAASALATSHVDLDHGRLVFTQNCAACHGATGEGGAGPILKGEKARKNQAAAIAWIKDPSPPMPKLYPSPLSDRDVSDVAAFVETL